MLYLMLFEMHDKLEAHVVKDPSEKFCNSACLIVDMSDGSVMKKNVNSLSRLTISSDSLQRRLFSHIQD
jgi:hypothetical protein